jgi:hypothetical protein
MPLGYTPTLEDVEEYYRVEGPVLPALVRWGSGKQVKVGNWAEILDAKGVSVLESPSRPEELASALQQFLDQSFPDSRSYDVPPRYPAFHATVCHDIVLEIDAKQSRKQAFGEGRRILDFLERYEAPYLLKFSGNSSPHFIIPQAAYEPLVPEEKREATFKSLFRWLIKQLEWGGEGAGWLDSSFSDERHFLRMPYSLNERTGLVSLPIRPEDYDTFHRSKRNCRTFR